MGSGSTGPVDAKSSRWLPGAGHDAAHGPHMFREQVNDLGAARAEVAGEKHTCHTRGHRPGVQTSSPQNNTEARQTCSLTSPR